MHQQQTLQKTTYETHDLKQELNIIEISNALDEYFFLAKLQVYCDYLSYSKIVNTQQLSYQDTDIRLLSNIIESLQKNNFNNPLIITLLLIKDLYINFPSNNPKNEAALFEKLTDTIQKYKSQIPPDDGVYIYSFITNYCNHQINSGKAAYKTKSLHFHNQLINFLFDRKDQTQIFLSPSIYKNIVVLALNIENHKLFSSLKTAGLQADNPLKGYQNAFEWAEKFVKHYKNKLDEKAQKNYYPYCMAFIYFKQKRFQEACNELKEVTHIRGMFINLNTKMLFLMVLMELQLNDRKEFREHTTVSIEKVLDAYRALIRTDAQTHQKLNDSKKDFHKTFIAYYKKIYRFYIKYSGTKFKDSKFITTKQKLIDKIKNIKYSYQNWLLEKLDSIQ